MYSKSVVVDLIPDYVYHMKSVTMVGKSVAVCLLAQPEERRVIDVSMIPGAELRFTGDQLLFLYRGIDMPIGCIF